MDARHHAGGRHLQGLLKVTVTDLAGNASSTANAQTIIVDTTGPSAIATVTALSADTGTAGDFITSVAAQTVSGSYSGTLAAGEEDPGERRWGTTWSMRRRARDHGRRRRRSQPATGTLSVRSIDTAGNTSGTATSYTL